MKEVVVFSASWCGQCGPFKKALEQQGVMFENVDVDEQEDKVAEIGIRGLPTTIILEDGVEVKRISGNKVKEVMEALGE